MVDFGTPYGDNTKRFTVSHLLDLPRNGCCFLQDQPQPHPQHVDIEDGDKTEGKTISTSNISEIYKNGGGGVIHKMYGGKMIKNSFLIFLVIVEKYI